MVISKNEMKEAEKCAVEMGISINELMENSGRAIADCIEDKFGDEIKDKKILVVCGKGNNAGDGLVAARYLMDVCKNVEILLLNGINEMTQDAQENCEILVDIDETKVHCFNEEVIISLNMMKYDIVIDAMVGIGCQGELQYPYGMIAKHMNNSTNSFIVSVDIPSGVNSDNLKESSSNYVNANLIITFHDTKPALENKEFKDKVKIVDIGIPI